jgi:O-antigen/teichoic acid export membrane protein
MALSLQRAAWILLLGKLLRAPLWLLTSALLARLLGPEGVGTWSMVLAAAMLLNQLFIHWTQVLTQRFGRPEWNRSKLLDQTYSNRLPLLFLGIGLSLVMVFVDPLDWLERIFGVDSNNRFAVLAALISLWLLAETQTVQQAQERYQRMAWTPVMVDGVYIVVLASILVATQYMVEVSDSYSISLFSLFFLLSILWLISWFWELISLRVRFSLKLICKTESRVMLVFALPLVPAALVGYLAEWVDYFMLRHFLGEHAVGLFHPAFQYVLVMLGLPSALVAVILPRLIDAVERADTLTVSILINTRLLQYIYVWGCLTLPIAACLPWLLEWLLGAEFDQTSELIQIMLLVLPGALVQHICMTLCLVQGRLAFSTMYLFSIKLIVNALISFVLISQIGLIGAAFGMVAGYVVLHWMLLLDQLKRFNVNILSKLPAGLLLCQLLALALAMVDGVWLRIAVSFIGVVLLLGVVRMLRVLPRSEAEVFFAFAGLFSPLLVWLVSRK